MKRLLPLAGIEIFVWLVLLITTLIISKGVFSISFGRTVAQLIAAQVSKILVSALLVFVWLTSWKKVADIYLERQLARKRVNP